MSASLAQTKASKRKQQFISAQRTKAIKFFFYFLNKELERSLFSAQKRSMAQLKDVAGVFTQVLLGIRYPVSENKPHSTGKCI